MKKTWGIILVLLITAALLFSPLKVEDAQAEIIGHVGFTACSVDDPSIIPIVESQVYVEIWDLGDGDLNGDGGLVGFVVRNDGPIASSVTDIYFADGDLFGDPPDFVELYDVDEPNPPTEVGHPGVDFSLDKTAPPAPPPGECQFPPTTQFFATDSDAGGTSDNGVGPDEWLGIVMRLLPDKDFDDVVGWLQSGWLRIAIHVQAVGPNGKSGWFVDGGTTDIELVSFRARQARGKVMVTWETGTEIENAGFNIYRSETENGARSLLTSQLIAPKGDAVSGASYSLLDNPDYGTYYYWLEDISYSGMRTLHGPVKINVRPAYRRPYSRPVLPVQ